MASVRDGVAKLNSRESLAYNSPLMHQNGGKENRNSKQEGMGSSSKGYKFL